MFHTLCRAFTSDNSGVHMSMHNHFIISACEHCEPNQLYNIYFYMKLERKYIIISVFAQNIELHYCYDCYRLEINVSRWSF